MKFRLTYHDELRPTQGERATRGATPLADHKHKIRRHFHNQLREFWRTEPFLSTYRTHPSEHGYSGPRVWKDIDEHGHVAYSELVAEKNHRFGYRWVPLVRETLALQCSLSILFLRRDYPGSALNAGDIDNRVKTIIDTLRCPNTAEELAGNKDPLDGEDPFYVLMEDDKQVTHFTVETDRLLDPRTLADSEVSKANVIITVELRPYYVTMLNMSFA